MTLKSVSPQDAKKLLEQGEGYIYLDVRTSAEFQAGRPKGAVNVPIAQPNGNGQLMLNERFLDVVAANIAKDAKVIVGCRSGQRSAIAQTMLHQAGYGIVVNMDGGFAGVTALTGQVVEEGWSTLGFPVERGHAGSSGYEELQKNAGT